MSGLHSLSDVMKQRNELERRRMEHEFEIERLKHSKKGQSEQIEDVPNIIVLNFIYKVHAPVREASVVVGIDHVVMLDSTI